MSTRKTSTISKPQAAKALFTVPDGRDFHKEAALKVACTLTNLWAFWTTSTQVVLQCFQKLHFFHGNQHLTLTFQSIRNNELLDASLCRRMLKCYQKMWLLFLLPMPCGHGPACPFSIPAAQSCRDPSMLIWHPLHRTAGKVQPSTSEKIFH